MQKFEKGMDEKWMREIFQVRKPFMRFGIKNIRLIDLNGEELKGTLYEWEWQKISYSEDKTFEVEKMIKHQGRGNKKEVLVKWKDWPDKFNSCISSKNIPEWMPFTFPWKDASEKITLPISLDMSWKRSGPFQNKW